MVGKTPAECPFFRCFSAAGRFSSSLLVLHFSDNYNVTTKGVVGSSVALAATLAAVAGAVAAVGVSLGVAVVVVCAVAVVVDGGRCGIPRSISWLLSSESTQCSVLLLLLLLLRRARAAAAASFLPARSARPSLPRSRRLPRRARPPCRAGRYRRGQPYRREGPQFAQQGPALATKPRKIKFQ